MALGAFREISGLGLGCTELRHFDKAWDVGPCSFEAAASKTYKEGKGPC